MTITQAVIIVSILAIWSSSTNTDLTNNTTILIVLLIALIALAGVNSLFNILKNQTSCQNRILSSQDEILQTTF